MSKTLTLTLVVLLAAAQGPEGQGQTQLTPDPNNPILTPGAPGTWDSLAVRTPDVLDVGGTTYLFYSGRESVNVGQSIGLATAAGGSNAFTKVGGAPILGPSGSGFMSASVAAPCVLVDANGDWVMYFAADSVVRSAPGPDIGRAVSTTGAAGPYAPDSQPVLSIGNPTDLDSAWVHPGTVMRDASGTYRMFYSGGTVWPPSNTAPAMVFLATSTDGVSWAKYDDPLTPQVPDPVFQPGPAPSWDSQRVAFPGVFTDGVRWDMYYQGATNSARGPYDLGHASSISGTSWSRSPNGAVLSSKAQPWSSNAIIGASVVKTGSTYRVYYGGLDNNGGSIGLATSPETDDLFLDATPNPLQSQVTFSTWQAAASRPVYLFVIDVNGAPFVRRLARGTADANGIWTLGPVPVDPAVKGTPITLASFGFGRVTGDLVMSNLETIQ